MRARLSLLFLAVVAAGCPTTLSTTPVVGNGGGPHGGSSGGHHGTGGVSGSSSGGAVSDGGSSGASSGSSSSGASSSGLTGAGSSSGGSSGSGSSSSSSGGGVMACGTDAGNGTNTIFNCANVPYYDGDAGSCPVDWMGTVLLDFESCQPICGASVQAQTPEGVPIAGTAQFSQPPDGLFHFCLAADTTFETQVTAPGYATFYYGEIRGQLLVDLPSFGMLSTNELAAFATFLQPPLDFSGGAIVAFFVELGSCPTLGSQAGWTVWLTPDEDGGVYPDGGYQTLYIDDVGYPDPLLSKTSSYGVVILYNIDPSITAFPSLHAAPPDGGSCRLINPEVGFTGRFQTGAGIFAEQGLFLQ